MNKVAMMKRLTRPARMAGGGYTLPRISDDSVVGAYGQITRSNPMDTQPDTSNYQTPDVSGPNFNQAPPVQPAGPSKWAKLGNQVANVGESLAPFASNIMNAFQKPPMPALPTYDSSVTLTAPRYDAERNEVSREINGTNATLFRNLDANTAAKVALSNQGTKLDRLSSINERESNARADTSNRQALVNSGIQNRNNDKTDVYNSQLVERSIAQGRTQSENIANAGDKYVGIQNEKRKAKVDIEKTKTMAELFRNSGVGTRLRQNMKDDGIDDPTGQDYADLKKKASGGTMQYPNGGLTRGLVPAPTYNFATGSTPNASDSSAYNANFNSLRSGDPTAMKWYNQLNMYGVPSSVSPDARTLAMNQLGAYNDAAGKNMMTDQQVHDELYKPFAKPKDIKRMKKMGGSIPVGPSSTHSFNRALRPRANTSYRQLLTAKPQ